MSKIRALNEESSSSESEDETNRKLSKEAQEEQAKQKYNHALKTLVKGKKKDAAELLENLLLDPSLYPLQDDRQFTPFQQQLLLGCLKFLGDLYRDGECKDLERAKLMFEKAICMDQDDNINLWYRLGKISFEIGDLYTAHDAFAYALRLRPSHWGCLENLVTLSYALQDYINCLGYCATGLSKDPSFFKGLVFRDFVYNIFPELKSTINEKISNSEALATAQAYEECWKEKYTEELKQLQNRWKDRITNIQKNVIPPTPKIHFDLKSLSFVEVLKHVLVEYERTKNSSLLHETVQLTWSFQDSSIDSEDLSKAGVTEESQTEEESQSAIRRSRSSSDDKENNNTNQTDGASQLDENNEGRRVDVGSENSQPLEPQASGNEGDGLNKKKNKRDVKWWQMEGKRRSQRVRGHLMPTSPDKTKKESSFADQLKNLIPAPLLGDDGSNYESVKMAEKSGWQKKLNISYFGTKEEEVHVKQLLSTMTGSLPTILIHIVQFLVTKVKYPWPAELRELYLSAYKYYRSHVVSPCVLNYDPKKLTTDAFTCLTFIEIFVEKYRIELNIGDMSVMDVFNKEVFFLEECISLHPTLPKDLTLRVKWLTVRRLLQMALRSNEEHTNQEVCHLLSEIEAELRKDPITIWTVNESTNLICLESVIEKAAGIARMKNSQVVNDMFQNEQYDSLIGILQSCINFSEIEKRDLSDLFYYTVALLRTENEECIYQSLSLMNYSVRFQDNGFLSESLLLLEEIWMKMAKRFTLQHKRSAVGNLIKILVSCERKPPTQETILTIPWCLLHSILFSLEREEPAFYLEEETVPNSVLLLQMAHEFMSRSDKCCINGGKLMLYSMKAILEVKKLDEYISYEETRHCMEQAIFCTYSHPSKKSKIKYLKDHNASGIILTWKMCPTLFQYYVPDEFPEFDSYGSIGGDVESLLQRFLEIMPKELEPSDRQKLIETSIETCENLDAAIFEGTSSFPEALKDIYYLIGDYYFKSKEWGKAVSYYTWDLSVNPSRFDSWAAIALSLGENINTTLNTADEIDFRELLKKAQSTSHCFNNALKIDPLNMKLRIEFGSFVYAMHAYCSRLMKQQAACIDMDLFNIIETSQQNFLLSASKCFEPIAKNAWDSNDEAAEDELWIHHYMLGKIYEKTLFKEDADQYLKQYELAGKLLHEQGAPYPSKMNYYSPPELAIEALEIYYRIHASILNLVENCEYSIALEKLLVSYIRRQEYGPFIKSKQSRGDGESGKRGRKAAEDATSKKDMAEITALMKDMLDQTEKMVETVSTSSSSTSESSSDEESSTDSTKTTPNISPERQKPISSFSLAEFKKRLMEKELREEKIATVAKIPVSQPVDSVSPVSLEKSEDLYDGLDLENNRFYPALKGVKFGPIIALCLKAMEECISRYPYHFKAYYRLAHSFMAFMKDANGAKEYLMGSQQLSQRKINGLFGERKANNFFNGIWRNPIDDIDRPGSFSYHMNKTMQLLIDVLSGLNDHSLLADIALLLAKVPDNEKKYLSNPDREMFCQQAFNDSIASAKRRSQEPGLNYREIGLEVYETYQKLQKHNPRQNSLPSVLHDIYKLHCRSQGVHDEEIAMEHALKYFSFQHMTLKASMSRSVMKGTSSSQGATSEPQRPGGDNIVQKRRGRRAVRQTSQEISEFDNSVAYNSVAALLQARNIMEPRKPSTSNSGLLPRTSTAESMWMQGSIQGMMNPMMHIKSFEGMNRDRNTPPPAHEQNQSTKTSLGVPGNIPTHKLKPAANTDETLTTPVSLSRSQDDKAEAHGSSSAIPVKKVKTRIVRKPTGGHISGNVDTHPPQMPSLQPIRINTSPFKAQPTAVEQPPQFSFNKSKDSMPAHQPSERRDPPAAHSNVSPKKTWVDDDNQGNVEVIDLTVKLPEKNKEGRQNVLKPTTNLTIGKPSKSVAIIRKADPPHVAYPLPPKKKHHQMMFREEQASPPSVQPTPPPEQIETAKYIPPQGFSMPSNSHNNS